MSLIWYLTLVCEKEVCLLCAGSECVRFKRESVVRTAERFHSVNFLVF